MKPYKKLLEEVLKNGMYKEGRNGGNLSLFGLHCEFDNSYDTLPLVTLKKMPFKTMITELCFFLQIRKNIKWLQDRDVHIWDKFADDSGELGPIYGVQWYKQYYKKTCRHQLDELVYNLKHDPHSRRHILTNWDTYTIDEMALPPCPMTIQFYINEKNRLDAHLYQRSADLFLGVPFDIAQYAILAKLIGYAAGYETDRLIISYGDAHIYVEHIKQCKKMISLYCYDSPSIKINYKDIFTMYEPEDFELINYKSNNTLKGELKV